MGKLGTQPGHSGDRIAALAVDDDVDQRLETLTGGQQADGDQRGGGHGRHGSVWDGQ